jgi:hypothetical protein
MPNVVTTTIRITTRIISSTSHHGRVVLLDLTLAMSRVFFVSFSVFVSWQAAILTFIAQRQLDCNTTWLCRIYEQDQSRMWASTSFVFLFCGLERVHGTHGMKDGVGTQSQPQ